MSHRSTVLVGIIVVFLVTAHQAQSQTTITFGCGQPTSPSAGTISGSGSYTVDTGYSVSTIELIAELASGAGQGGQVTTTYNSSGSFMGQISCLPSGDYNVFARITVTKTCSPTLYFDSAVKIKVTVK